MSNVEKNYKKQIGEIVTVLCKFPDFTVKDIATCLTYIDESDELMFERLNKVKEICHSNQSDEEKAIRVKDVLYKGNSQITTNNKKRPSSPALSFEKLVPKKDKVQADIALEVDPKLFEFDPKVEPFNNWRWLHRDHIESMWNKRSRSMFGVCMICPRCGGSSASTCSCARGSFMNHVSWSDLCKFINEETKK
jgi:hypothetical protein